MDRRLMTAGLLVAGLALTGCATHSAAPRPGGQPTTAAPIPSSTAPGIAQRFIVTLEGEPVATYEGDADGAGRTAPEAGQPFDPNSAAAKQRSSELIATQQALADEYGFTIMTHYTHTLNGFSADLTAEQVAELEKADGVAGVEADRVVPLDSTTPSVVDGS